MSQKTESGPKIVANRSSKVIVMLSLAAGALIITLLFVLRAHEQRSEPGGTDQTTAAARLGLNKMGSDEVQKWIAEKMKQDGAKVAVVNIWATWCEPCRAEMPELANYQKTKQAPLFLISADNEIDEPSVRSFLVESGVNFESSIVKGDQQEFVEKWQNLSSNDPARQWSMTLPATFLINASGQIISFHVGTSTAAELTLLVKKSLDTLQD
jgi:thiol-disulfide isomerase/thioredoxin